MSDKEAIPGLNKHTDPVIRTAYTVAYRSLHELVDIRSYREILFAHRDETKRIVTEEPV